MYEELEGEKNNNINETNINEVKELTKESNPIIDNDTNDIEINDKENDNEEEYESN